MFQFKGDVLVEKTDLFISTFKVEEQLENLALNSKKPSSRILQTKIGIKSIALLKKIQTDHNHSWYQEVYERAKDDMEKVALFYRGNKITYREMFEKADIVAKSLLELGVKKDDEIPCCLANTPELVYIMLGANKIGAKLNLFGTNLDKDYLYDIVNDTSKKLFITTDNLYGKIKDTISRFDFENKLMVSLHDSLPEHPELCDEYEEELDHYYHYDDLVDEYKKEDASIMSFNEFLETGKKCQKEVIDDNDLETEFAVTYTSGSTRKGKPKAIVHCNRSYIVGGIYNNTNLTGSPEVPEIRGLAHIHSDSNTNLVTCISDNLIKHGSVALEPEYDKDKFLDYIRINKPVHLDATTSFLIQAAKDYYKRKNETKQKLKFPNMLVTMAVGEKASIGEEKFINHFLLEANAGSDISLNGIKLPCGPLSIGGGDCEHGGIFYTLLKKLQAVPRKPILRNKDYGMVPVPFAVVTALKKMEDGSYEECNYNENGIIVANSITSMKGYKNNPEATRSKIITDRYGREWLSCDVYGYVNHLGNVVIHGRMEDKLALSDGQEIYTYMIDDVVSADSKNILSCTTVAVDTKLGKIPVINVEFSPLTKRDEKYILTSMIKRIEKRFGTKFDYAIRKIDGDSSFPLNGSGKRDIPALEQMGLDNTIKIFNRDLEDYGLIPDNRPKTLSLHNNNK
jgi:acyl-coenzyme A synthetase/AMP-(fatty) acid ligase